jgi:hypothetical protein
VEGTDADERARNGVRLDATLVCGIEKLRATRIRATMPRVAFGGLRRDVRRMPPTVDK